MPVRAGRRWLRAGRPRLADVAERLIPGPGGPIPIRMYRPFGDAPLPALVFCHGGGWVHGDLDSHDAVCRALAGASGWLVVALAYRLAPVHRFPAALADAYAAARWVAAQGATIGVDPSCLAVGGDSAGGNLAAAVALMARDRGGPSLAFQRLVYPELDFSFDSASYLENAEYGPARAEMMEPWRLYLPTEATGDHPYASPLRAADLRGLPPTLIITAELDTLRDEG
jgi:acetyl esterase